MDKVKLAVVGCGGIAGYTALAARLVPRVTLTACCDIDLERAQSFARRYGVSQVFADYAELLQKANLDAVYLAVPHHLHYDMILAACRLGKPVFVEKPLTRTLTEGVNLIQILKQLKVKVGVNYQYRYDRGCYALGRAMQNGVLGKIHTARINIPWRRTQNYFNRAAWHATFDQAGGGTLLTQGSHFLDVVLWGLGEQPASAMGYTAQSGFDVEVDTLAHGIVETSGGTLVSITSMMVASKEQAVTIDIYGERGTAYYRDLPLPTVKFVGVKARKEHPPERGVHALQRSLSGFAKWVLADKPYLIPAESALPVLAAVDGIYRSAKEGLRTKIECL